MRPALSALAVLLALACGASVETYEVRGFVEAVDPPSRQIKIAHEDIPGFMPAMTMNFGLDPELLEGIEPGMTVEFTLERSGAALRITRIAPVGEGGAGEVGMSGRTGFEPPPERAPGFALVDHAGRPLTLEDLAGRAVVLDFVFTRCPGPCPILTSSHVTLQRSLSAEVAARTHFVSISLDPEYDTPERLEAYATERGADLANWSFLTGDSETVRAVASSYHVATKLVNDVEIDHVIATFLISPDGRIAKRYLGLEHDPEQIRADLTELLL